MYLTEATLGISLNGFIKFSYFVFFLDLVTLIWKLVTVSV